MELSARYCNNFLVGQIVHKSGCNLTIISTVTKATKSSVSPREQLLLFRNCCRVTFPCRNELRLLLRQLIQSFWFKYVKALHVIVTKLPMTSIAPSKDSISNSEAHGMEFTAGDGLDRYECTQLIIDGKGSGGTDALATVETQRTITTISP